MNPFQNKYRFFLILGLGLTVHVSAGFSWAQAFNVGGDGSADQKLQGFNLQGFNDDGSVAWDVNGSKADILGSTISLSDVDANNYGEYAMNVKADTGVIDQKSGDLHLKSDVIITSESGAQLRTESLNWSKHQDLVSTEDKVLIVDSGVKLAGKGMEAKPGLRNAHIREDVRVEVDTEPDADIEQILTITSDGPLTIDQNTQTATFQDNVIAIQGTRILRSDRVEIYFNEKMDMIEKLLCLGNVEIEQGDNKTYADKATYDAILQRLTLSGRPKLILITEGQDAITSIRD